MNDLQVVRPIEILLVEDSICDAELMAETLSEAEVLNTLHIVEDGVEALDFLRHRGKFANAQRPDLILLDLNLPRKSGREVLAEIKTDPTLNTIPIVVLTTSAAQEDIVKSYQLHANCYVTKPVGLDEFIDVIKYIELFWLNIVRLPPNPQ
jgi:two-component system, chemotaxis family, response regulator Rcp1